MLKKMQTGLVLAVVVIMAIRSDAGNELYSVGSTEGKRLYWENIANTLDTIGLEDIGKNIWSSDRFNGVRSIRPAAMILGKSGQNVYKINDGSAASVAVAVQNGYTVLALTQWGATPSDKLLVSKPGMGLSRKKQRIVSDFLWEIIDSAAIHKPPQVQSDLPVKLFFRSGGYSTYPGRSGIILQPQAVAGIQGFTLEYENEVYAESLTMQRMILGVYLIASSETGRREISATIDKGMDRYELDLSFKTPALKPAGP
jgi:hypothetical protein